MPRVSGSSTGFDPSCVVNVFASRKPTATSPSDRSPATSASSVNPTTTVPSGVPSAPTSGTRSTNAGLAGAVPAAIVPFGASNAAESHEIGRSAKIPTDFDELRIGSSFLQSLVFRQGLRNIYGNLPPIAVECD